MEILFGLLAFVIGATAIGLATVADVEADKARVRAKSKPRNDKF